LLYKGADENLNYFIPSDLEGFYDLRYEYPNNSLRGNIAQTHNYLDPAELAIHNS